MRLLHFNNSEIDTDEKTAIGIDFQKYNIGNPKSRYAPTSNNFSIPLTDNNKKVIGFGGDPRSVSNIIYNPIVCDYSLNNEIVINKGTARITSISDRINCFAFSKSGFWEDVKEYTWTQFQYDYLDYLQTVKGVASLENEFTGVFTDFIGSISDTTEDIILPYYISNLYNYNNYETLNELCLQFDIGGVAALGGHFCTFVKTIFEFLEIKFNVDLSVNDIDTYNIFNDPVASTFITPLRNIRILKTTNGFAFTSNNTRPFLPSKDLYNDHADKSLGDFIESFFQHFNCIIDSEIKEDGTNKYIIRRFDDIINAPVVKFSGINESRGVFKPSIDGWKQNNYIKFSNIYETGSSLVNSKYIKCYNRNIEVGTAESSLFDIKAYIPNQYDVNTNKVLNLSTPESFKEFSFFVLDTAMTTNIQFTVDGVMYLCTRLLQVARIYDLNNEYNLIESMLAYPVFYEASKFLTLNQIRDLQYFANYEIKELGGYFFINKISGFNPESSIKETKIELIKIQ